MKVSATLDKFFREGITRPVCVFWRYNANIFSHPVDVILRYRCKNPEVRCQSVRTALTFLPTAQRLALNGKNDFE